MMMGHLEIRMKDLGSMSRVKLGIDDTGII